MRSVREMQKADINLIIDYFLKSDAGYLGSLGVDINKLPEKEKWIEIMSHEFEQPPERKKLYYLVWQINDTPVGHSHINDIIFGEEAYMHLHMWHQGNRRKGDGTYFIKESLSFYFRKFKLKKIFCQPYALNPAPNKTLSNAGFEFVKEYETIPGWLNFKQLVNLWVLNSSTYYDQINASDAMWVGDSD